MINRIIMINICVTLFKISSSLKYLYVTDYIDGTNKLCNKLNIYLSFFCATGHKLFKLKILRILNY